METAVDFFFLPSLVVKYTVPYKVLEALSQNALCTRHLLPVTRPFPVRPLPFVLPPLNRIPCLPLFPNVSYACFSFLGEKHSADLPFPPPPPTADLLCTTSLSRTNPGTQGGFSRP